MTSWLNGLQSDAQRYIDDLGVLSREAVRQYYLPLWVWHRLDSARWAASKVALRDSKRATVSTEVDHVVAVKLWEKLISASPTDSIGTGGDEEDDDSSPVNALGNCCLLEKTFNISKGAEPLRTFLVRVHEFKADKAKIAPWAESLSISAELVDPTAIGSAALANVRKAVNERTDKMKTELKAYILGTRLIQDL
jgi:hypothetical protein